MPTIVMIVLVIFVFGMVFLSIVSRGSNSFSSIAKWLLVMLLSLAAMFCIYGFIASFELGQSAFAFKVGYGIGLFVLMAMAAWILLRR